MKRYEASRTIIEYLEKGPAFPKQISYDLGIPYNTVMNNLRVFLPQLGIVKQLPDGKYGLKWYLPEEDNTRSSYDVLSRKLLRPPTPEEFAGMIKEGPEVARELLFKYISEYHIPTEDEIVSSAVNIWKMISHGGLDVIYASKKQWFEQGIEKFVIEGIDQMTLDEFLKEAPIMDLDEARIYLKEFPQMGLEIDIEEKKQSDSVHNEME